MKKRKLVFYKILLPGALPLLPAFLALLAGCITAPPKENLPANLFFVSQTLPDLGIPVETGGRTENPEDEKGVIRDAFREAYTEAMLRGLNLKGILGSDRVNPWPRAAPVSWSQNWESAPAGAFDGILPGAPNSWGLPNMVLALGNYRALNELSEISGKEKALAYVWCVTGPILDMYGKSEGYGKANGAAGYGVPLGEAFFSEGSAVQRFSRGRIIISPEESSFVFQDDLFEFMLETLEPAEIENEFGGKNIGAEISNAFIYAWAYAFSEQEGKSDGPVVRVDFPKPWIMETTINGNPEKITMKCFYYKSYNQFRDIFVIFDSDRFPLRARRLSGSFLQAILSGSRLPGMKPEKKLGPVSGKDLGRTLAEGFAVYGPPLSDPLPMPIAELEQLSPQLFNTVITTDAEEVILFLEAQRFGRGWMLVKPDLSF